MFAMSKRTITQKLKLLKMKLSTITGTYGSHKTETTIFIATTNRGTWYVCEGGTTVNYTYDEVSDGVDVEELSDVDCFTWSKGINSLDELQYAIEN